MLFAGSNEDNYFIEIALSVAKGGTCLRRRYGSVLVKDGAIIATGHNGACKKELSCIETGDCQRNTLREKKGEVYEVCRGLHSEMMTIINAGSERAKRGTLYVAAIDTQSDKLFESKPCDLCERIIKQVDVARVVCHPKEAGLPLIEY